MRSILDKYQVASKAEPASALADWDFDTWLATHTPSLSFPSPRKTSPPNGVPHPLGLGRD